MATWIKGGRVVDPARGTARKRDIIVDRGRIAEMVPPKKRTSRGSRLREIDATGKIVIPGLIDMHVHLREPGHEYKETIATGAMAGVKGGFTGLACMPNTDPVNDDSSVTQFILRQAQAANLLKVYPVAAISLDQKGERLTDFGDLREAGAVGVSDDGLPVVHSDIMRRAMEYAHYQGLVVISHCEDLSLSAGGVMHEGVVSTQIGLPGIPAESEEIMVYRDIALAKLTRCPVHIAHVSTGGSVNLIRQAKAAGIPLTAETAPHYFTLDHTAVIGYDTHAKMNPPLRTPEDVEAVKRGLADGTIDIIATDHAPHSPLEKEVEFDRAAFGIIGLETALPLSLALVKQGVLTLPEVIRKLSYEPAALLGIEGGYLREGMAANLAIIDPDLEYVLDEKNILSKSKNTPFLGMTLKGGNTLTMVGGRIVWKRSP